MLTSNDAAASFEHLVRNFPSPGVGAPPISMPFPRGTKFNRCERIIDTQKRWSLPPGQHGWERGWGLFDEKDLVGEVTLSTARQIETQIHRAILGITIEMPYRGGGHGTALLKTALTWAREQEFLAWIDLEVFTHNAGARHLYSKFGFIEVGRVADRFRVDGVRFDDIQMSLELRQCSV